MFAQQISYYKLIKKLGAGGMGEVYLAEDTRLNRKVALKILPVNVAKDRKFLSRFWQEARLAANLNHPNICTIYEVNDTAETSFIAMEYVEGETLLGKIQSASLDLSEILEIVTQIADALDEAHEHGVIHRDIKPANIIINRRGSAKVLDFGLAKNIIEEVSEEAITQAKTDAGILVGTVQYMSPEHATGKTLDGRTDLWSIGVLLYELATGETPFKGQTQVGIFDEILNKAPVAPSALNEHISPELEKIILKLLEKDHEFRYQTASDLRADLRRLQRTSEGYISSRKVENPAISKNSVVPSTAFLKTQTDEFSAQRDTGKFLNLNKNSLWQKLLFGLVGLVLLIGTGFGIYQLTAKNTVKVTFEKRNTQRITDLGKVADAIISADGKYLVYVLDEGELQSLWIKQIATGSSVQVLAPTDVRFQGLDISPDSNWIYYNVWDKKSVGEIFRVPVLGGVSQKVIHDCMPGVGISPDSQQIAFIRSYDKEKENRLIVANIESREEKTLAVRTRDNGGLYAFAWSPDGKTLATISTLRNEKNEYPFTLNEISIENSKETSIWQIPAKLQNFSGGLIWQPDKSELLITLAESQTPYYQIWQVAYPSGEAKQLTKDFNQYGRLSLTADGKNLVSVQRDFFSSLWVVPADNPSLAQKITSGKIEGLEVGWTPNGKVVYSSTISGNIDVWMSDADGSNKKQLTSDLAVDAEPCVTADGKSIAFTSNRNASNWNTWLMNLDGTNQRQLMQIGSQWNISCSKLENSVWFHGNLNKKQGIWKIPVSGGEPTIISDKSYFRTDISPDEKRLAYAFWDEDKKQMNLDIYTIGTDKTEKLELPRSVIGEGQNEPSVKWTPDGRNFSFINQERETTNIWTQPVAGGKPKKITNFGEYRVYRYEWSPDGRKIVLQRGMSTSDVVLIKEDK